MTSNQYKFFSQKKFHGGIETRQEFIEDNQLLDARNHWAPLGEMEQRPGVHPRRYLATQRVLTASDQAATTIWTDTSAATDFVLTPAVSVMTNIAYGDFITFQFSSGALLDETVCDFFLYSRNTNSVAKTRLAVEVWTSRGWIGVPHEFTRFVSSESLVMYPFAAITAVAGYFEQRMSVALPSDVVTATKTFTTGSYTGKFVRFFIASATDTTGAPFTAGVIYGDAPLQSAVVSSNAASTPLNSADRNIVPGAYLLKYNSGNAIASLWVRPMTTSPADVGQPRLSLSVAAGLTRNSVFPSGFTGTLDVPTNRYDARYKRPPSPPSVTVLPEWNTAYMAYANLIFEIPYFGARAWYQSDTYSTGTIAGPLVATVNTDPLIVGPISVTNTAVPYSTDLYPQLTSFPAANLIVYFRNQLFCAGILGIGNLIRWSGSSTDGAYNVWPEDNQVTLSTAKDNSEITAIAPLNDNLVVFKKNSIWQMIDNGISDVNLPLYEPRLVVAGVGTVAHQSVQAVEGGLIFLAEDGFYFYDGTPNIKRISDPIQPYIDRINPARSPFAVATTWRSKQTYMCAVSLDSETQANDFVFVYDYQNGAWWVWDGWDVQCWLQIDGVGLKEEVYYLDKVGLAFKLGAWTQSDNGAEIDSWFLTPRFGFDDAITKTALELRVRGINNNPTVNYNVIGDDVEINVTGSTTVDPLTLPITMAGVDEAQYADDEVYGEAVYAPTRRRERKSTNRTTASWFQIRIRKMLKVFGFDLGWEVEGRR